MDNSWEMAGKIAPPNKPLVKSDSKDCLQT